MFYYKIVAGKKTNGIFHYFITNIKGKNNFLKQLNESKAYTDIYEKQYRIGSKEKIKSGKLKKGQLAEIEQKYQKTLEYITIDIDIRKEIEEVVNLWTKGEKIDYQKIQQIAYKRLFSDKLIKLLEKHNIPHFVLLTSKIGDYKNYQIKIPLDRKQSKINNGSELKKGYGFKGKLNFLNKIINDKNLPIDVSTLKWTQLTRVPNSKRKIKSIGYSKNLDIKITNKNKYKEISRKQENEFCDIQQIIDFFLNEFKGKIYLNTNTIFYNAINDDLYKLLNIFNKNKKKKEKDDIINKDIEKYIVNNFLSLSDNNLSVINHFLNSSSEKRHCIIYFNKTTLGKHYTKLLNIINSIKVKKKENDSLKNIIENDFHKDDNINLFNNINTDNDIKTLKKYIFYYINLNSYKNSYYLISNFINIGYENFRKKQQRLKNDQKKNNTKKHDIYKKYNVDITGQRLKNIFIYYIVKYYIKNFENKNMETLKKDNENYIENITGIINNNNFDVIRKKLYYFNNLIYNFFKNKNKQEIEYYNNSSRVYKLVNYFNREKSLELENTVSFLKKHYLGTTSNITCSDYLKTFKIEKEILNLVEDYHSKIFYRNSYIIENINNIEKVNDNKIYEDISEMYNLHDKVFFLKDLIKKNKKIGSRIILNPRKVNNYQKNNYKFMLWILYNNYTLNKNKVVGEKKKYDKENIYKIIKELNDEISLLKSNDIYIEYCNNLFRQGKDQIKIYNFYIYNKKKLLGNSLFQNKLFFNDESKEEIKAQKIFSFLKKNFIEGKRFNILRWSLRQLLNIGYEGNIFSNIRKYCKENWEESEKVEGLFQYFGI